MCLIGSNSVLMALGKHMDRYTLLQRERERFIAEKKRKKQETAYYNYVFAPIQNFYDKPRERRRSVGYVSIIKSHWKEIVRRLNDGQSVNRVMREVLNIRGGSQYNNFRKWIEIAYDRHKSLRKR